MRAQGLLVSVLLVAGLTEWSAIAQEGTGPANGRPEYRAVYYPAPRIMPEPPTPIVPAPRSIYGGPAVIGGLPPLGAPICPLPYGRPFDNFTPYYLQPPAFVFGGPWGFY